MSETPIAILARDLTKVYRIYKSPLDVIKESLFGKSRHIECVALNRVNLEVRRSEIVGVLGRNGAGKSTLLKVISGTLERTAGDMEVRGRVTAILQLGTGFHPEYTGLENIYMGGMCLGMSRQEVDSKLDSIIEFSELRDVIEHPFKTYSTGMQARLTFSVAISVDPDILIVDEALSVGDARFQQKCFSRIQLLREKSTTVLLVSHDTNTITALCDRALILENGCVYAEGEGKEMSVVYHNLLFGQQKQRASVLKPTTLPSKTAVTHAKMPVQPHAKDGHAQIGELATGTFFNPLADVDKMRYGSGEARLVEWGLLDEHGNRCAAIQSGSVCRMYMVLDCQQEIEDLSCGFAIKDRRGTVLWGVTNLSYERTAYKAAAGAQLTIFADCVMWLSAGFYTVTLGAAHLQEGKKIDFVEDAIEFKVIGPDGIFTTSVVNLQTELGIELKSSGVQQVTGS